jgi:hypothetical protein
LKAQLQAVQQVVHQLAISLEGPRWLETFQFLKGESLLKDELRTHGGFQLRQGLYENLRDDPNRLRKAQEFLKDPTPDQRLARTTGSHRFAVSLAARLISPPLTEEEKAMSGNVPIGESVERARRALIAAVFSLSDGDIKRTAKILEMSQQEIDDITDIIGNLMPHHAKSLRGAP